MARPARPERSRSARSSRQFSRFYHSINPDRVFGTHSRTLGLPFGAMGISVAVAASFDLGIVLRNDRTDDVAARELKTLNCGTQQSCAHLARTDHENGCGGR